MSTSNDKITLYNASICPYAQRALLALKEAGTEFETVEIDLLNKPEWYKDVNPEGKVPALSVEGEILAESLVIIEYVNDRFPEANLLPKEAIKRANIRFAIEYFSSKVVSSFYKYAFNDKAEGALESYKNDINAPLARFAELLTQQSATGPYFLGEQFSLADIAIAPFVVRILALNKVALKNFEFDAVKNNPRLASFFDGVVSRPSVQESFIGDQEFINYLKKKVDLTIY